MAKHQNVTHKSAYADYFLNKMSAGVIAINCQVLPLNSEN